MNRHRYPAAYRKFRLVARAGAKNRIKRRGVRISRSDLYVHSLSASWFSLAVMIVMFYAAFNAFFAYLYFPLKPILL